MTSEVLTAVLEAPRRFRPYPQYKNSGIEWLGEIPAHWHIKRLKATVTSCQNGVWGDEPSGENDIACIGVADFDRLAFGVNLSNPTFRSIEMRIVRDRALAAGDLLLEKSGGGDIQPVGVVVLYDHGGSAVCSNFIGRMSVAKGFVPRFLVYLHAALYAARINVRSIKQSTGIQNLDSETYLSEHVGIPDPNEQDAIASFLDRETAKIDALAAKKERVIELLQEKRTALITQAVTKGLDRNVPKKESGVEWLGEIPAHWSTSQLKFVAKRIADCPHETPVYSDDGDYCVIRTADVGEGILDLSNARRVTAEEYRKRIRRMSLEADDIVYSREGERFGFAALVPAGPGACLGQRMMQFRLGSGSSPRYVMWQLNSKATYQQAALDVFGATSPHVNVETIKNFWLAVPPRQEQDSIAKYIDHHCAASDSLAAKIRAGIDRLKEFRTALISAAVTGKVDVREGAA